MYPGIYLNTTLHIQRLPDRMETLMTPFQNPKSATALSNIAFPSPRFPRPLPLAISCFSRKSDIFAVFRRYGCLKVTIW